MEWNAIAFIQSSSPSLKYNLLICWNEVLAFLWLAFIRHGQWHENLETENLKQ